MEDFKNFSKRYDSSNNSDTDIFGLINNLAGKFDGKSPDELFDAVYKEAEKGKKNGTLTNDDIDNFANAISPFFDDKKRKYLRKIVEELKKI